MKKILIAILLFCISNSYAQQGNYCQLLYKAFNTSEDGFPFLRPKTNEDTIKNFLIDKDTLNNYGFLKGDITKWTKLKSNIVADKTFTAWTLTFSTEKKYGDYKWEDIKENITASTVKFLQLLEENCFGNQLQRSEAILSTKNDGNVLVCYFYPKQITLPKDANEYVIDDILKEVPSIKFYLSAPFLQRGIFVNYQINGVKYND